MTTVNPVKTWFQRVILRRYGLCFIVMGLSFFGFGIGTLNLIYVFKACEYRLAYGLTDGL